MRGIGFLMAVICAAGLDGMGWRLALVGCFVGAVLMIMPMIERMAKR